MHTENALTYKDSLTDLLRKAINISNALSTNILHSHMDNVIEEAQIIRRGLDELELTEFIQTPKTTVEELRAESIRLLQEAIETHKQKMLNVAYFCADESNFSNKHTPLYLQELNNTVLMSQKFLDWVNEITLAELLRWRDPRQIRIKIHEFEYIEN